MIMNRLYVKEPFVINIDDELVELTKAKLKLARFPIEQDIDESDWSQGARVAKVKEVADYWLNEYDWREIEKNLNNEFKHYKTVVDIPKYGELRLHFVHELSNREDAIPLLFCHGWPGSFIEIRKVVKELANPVDSTKPAFHVVVPSIPGFGFSDAPKRHGINPSKVAIAYDKIMNKVLGYEWYVTQGGDFGSFISRSIGHQFPSRCKAQHLNMFPVAPPTIFNPCVYIRYLLRNYTYTDWEKEALRFRKNFEIDQSGYLEQQKTRPQTIGFAVGDSPIGLLAWFIEKFHDWVDTRYYNFTNEEIVNFCMMHWIQGCTPGFRFYHESFYLSNDTDNTFEYYNSQPTGVSMYPKEQLHCPRDWATKAANIVFWREHNEGGHFSSVEQPEKFLKDIQDFVTSREVKRVLKN